MTAGTLTGRRAASHEAARRLVVSYNRISKFRAAVGTHATNVDKGVDRQQADADRAAVDYGLGAVDRHYVDNDRSASEYASKEREAFLELLADLETGSIGVLLVWVLDRIVRDPSDLEHLIGLCRKHHVRLIQTASGSELDPNNPESVLHARITGDVAAYEAAKASMRQRRKQEDSAAKGKPHGGPRRFGYTAGMESVNEAEAEAIAGVVTAFLAGESLRSLAAQLNRDEVPTVRGGQWSGPSLGQMIGGPHLAGLRVRGGVVIGAGTWPGIIPVETHHQVVAMLANPDRRPKGVGNVRVHLLPGVMVCDTCGGPVRTKATKVKSYQCATGRHAQRRVHLVDRVVESAMVGRLASLDPATGVLVDDEAGAELARRREGRAALDVAYADLVAAHTAGELTARAFGAATAGLEAQMDQLDSAIVDASVAVGQAARVLEGATGDVAAAKWFGDPEAGIPGWSLARKRAIITELAEVRLRGGRTGNGFNPEDVIVEWR